MSRLTLAKWTVEEYHRLIEVGILAERQVELIAGEIVEMTPEKPLHRRVTFKLADYLREKLRGRAIIFEAHPITLFNSEPEPDIVIAQLPLELYDERHPYPEDIYLIIEISDTTLSKDLDTKKKIYALAGIVEYWVVDIQGSQVKVFREPQGDSYLQEFNCSRGVIVPEAFPDLRVVTERILSN